MLNYFTGFLMLFISLASVGQALTGTKTIPGDYADFTAAFTALNTYGVGSGGVTFEVASNAVFNERPPVLYVKGTAANQIVFRRSGSGNNPIIIPNTSGTSVNGYQSGMSDALVAFAGVHYLTWDGIDIRENASYSSNSELSEVGFLVLRKDTTTGSKHITIKNCRIKLKPGYMMAVAILITDFNSAGVRIGATSVAGAHESISIAGIYADSVFSGVIKYGQASVASPDWYDDSISIRSCTFYALGGSVVPSGCRGVYIYNMVKTLFIENNLFRGSSLSTTTITGIEVGVINNANISIQNNQLVDFFGQGTVYGILNKGGTRTSNAFNQVIISNNSIRRCSSFSTVYSGEIYGIKSDCSPAFARIDSNFIDSLSGDKYFMGIYSLLSPDSLRIEGNTLSNFNFGKGGVILSAYQSTPDTVSIRNNVISGIYGSGNIYSIVTFSSPSAKWNIEGNRIEYIEGTGSSRIFGIYVENNGVSHLHRNLISELRGRQVTGIGSYRPGETVYIYNNVIYGLQSDSSICGIRLAVEADHSLYHNTVFLDMKNPVRPYFYSTCLEMGTNQSVEARNNIFVNVSDTASTGGYNCVLRSWYSLRNSKDNIFYTGGTTAKQPIHNRYSAGSFISMQEYLFQFAGDRSSEEEFPPFKNISTAPYDLDIDTSQYTRVANGGTMITSPVLINSDFYGTPRTTATVDIGAFEGPYRGDEKIAPQIIFSEHFSSGVVELKRTLSRVIIKDDSSGIRSSNGEEPRLYYKKYPEANVIHTNDSTTQGWKWVSGTKTSDTTYSFIMDFTLLDSNLVVGDQVVYFVVASDDAYFPNIAVSGAYMATQPISVALNSYHFPATLMYHTFMIKEGRGGTVTVGNGGDYPTLTGENGLFQDMKNKVLTSPLDVKIISDIVEPGTYELGYFERHQFGNYPLLIGPDTAEERIIQVPAVRTANPVIRLVSCENVHFNGSYRGEGEYLFFNFDSSGGTFFQLLADKMKTEPCRNISIRHSKFAMDTPATSSLAILIGPGYSQFTTLPNDDIHDVDISENYFFNLNGPVFIKGNEYSSMTMSHLRFENNKFGDFKYGGDIRYTGIYATDASDIIIRGNQFNELLSENAICLEKGIKNVQISSNRITNFGRDQVYASAVKLDTDNKSSNICIDNNFISGNKAAGADYGPYYLYWSAAIFVDSPTGGVQIFNNSINFDDTVSVPYKVGNAGIFVDGSYNLDIRNNAISNTMVNADPIGGYPYGLFYQPSSMDSGLQSVDFNNIYTGSIGKLIQYNNVEYSTLAQLQAAYPAKFTNTMNCSPEYFSRSDLRTTASCLSGSGDSTGLVWDIFGNARSLSSPSIGAHEYIEYDNDIGIIDLSSRDICRNDTAIFDLVVVNTGLNTVSAFDVEFSFSGDSTFQYTLSLTSTLASKQRDTLHLLIPIKAKTGIKLNVACSLNFNLDEDSTNDTQNMTYQLMTTPVSMLIGDTICPGTSALLKVQNSVPSTTFWYTFIGATSFGNGDQISTSTLTDTTTFYAIARDSIYGCYGDFDSVKVVVHHGMDLDLGTDEEICLKDSFFFTANHNYSNYLWNTQDTLPGIWVKNSGVYILEVLDSNGCIQRDSVGLIADTCVWPGDANNDGIANNFDVLHLGLHFNSTGTQRNNASLNWIPQFSLNWGSGSSSMTDPKFADTDGNGTVNFSDTVAVGLNYGLTHNKKAGGIEGDPGDIPFYLQFGQNSGKSGELIEADLILGELSNPVTSYGLAFSFEGLTGIQQGSLEFVPTGSWLTDSAENNLVFVRYSADSARVDIAVSGTGQQNKIGAGKIGQVKFRLKHTGSPVDLNLYPSSVLLVDKIANQIPVYNLPLDTLTVIDPTGINAVHSQGWLVFPNPATSHIVVQGIENGSCELSLYNSLGQLVSAPQSAITGGSRLSVGHLNPGIYILVIKRDDRVYRQQVVIN